jgi:hypothetical protein
MLSKTRTVVLAVTLSAASMAPTFAIGYSESDADSPHTVFPTGVSNGGACDGLTDSGTGNIRDNSIHRFRRNGEQVGDFERSDRFATN